ncbi:hypothetical protein [Halomontanus rarus]|uniref:hypothetical protein n=1 Tax=Halomontanus rarus TaxID=3034020 RepID=UPI001A99AE57
MIENADEKAPDLSGLDYREANLLEIWSDIKEILRKQDGLCGEEIADELDSKTYGYRDASIRNGILPRIREPLNEQGFISVTEVPGEDEKIVKKEWRIADGD